MWDSLKRDITEFVSKCPNCQHVKAEHVKPSGLIQETSVPTWKWEEIIWNLLLCCLESEAKRLKLGCDG